MKTPLAILLSTVVLDAMGIGLIFPILPSLIQSVTHRSDIALSIGALAALYAAMQFIFAPVLGALSDRFGRRPVLMVSLGGAVVNYLFLAFAPSLPLIFLGRAIAGLTAATVAVASAALTDISDEGARAGRFGLLNAMFGIGFIAGPVLGGMLGDHWLRLPFLAAAGLNAANLLLAVFVLPETRKGQSAPITLTAFNPLRPLVRLVRAPALLPMVLVFFVFSAAGEAYGVCWALWGADAFGWSGFMIGVSLGMFGLCQMLVQALLPGRATRLLGARGAVLSGIAAFALALIGLAFVPRGFLVFLLMPLVALGSVGVPALQALATEKVSAERQGELQGVLASAVSLASVIAPLAFARVYAFLRPEWPGAIWLAVATVYVAAIPVVFFATARSSRSDA
ncbi:TCR/Tet family MFS transporter [Martelella sp. HB161492]|uniref:TCR/Tet family MFS transporter n=1 Tax=Martelella sp. HB161492 TaxID=2720726 RepID=UPI0015917F77|nr:TCR/Tet family MFS transporter [Martelella sp. HB161492]